MEQMSLQGAITVLENGLDHEDIKHIESTEAYHYFSSRIFIGEAPVKQEVRIDAVINIDDQFHIQGRPWGSEYWEHIDSVSSDWHIDAEFNCDECQTEHPISKMHCNSSQYRYCPDCAQDYGAKLVAPQS